MSKMIIPLILCLFIGLSFPITTVANSYGWGYKKNNDHKVPDVGKYEQMLQAYEAFYVDPSGEKVIYLTFDNGYETGHTATILDVLAEEQVPATFFVTGHYVAEEPELIQRMVKDGHIIGNHSYNHPDFTKLSKRTMEEELRRLEKEVAEITEQKEMNYVRPPRGTFNEQTLRWAEEFGYIHIFWSLAFKDWLEDDQKGWRYAYDQVMDQVHPGAIILLHTVAKDNADALQKIIKDLKKKGYTFKSLDDLIIKKHLPDFLFSF